MFRSYEPGRDGYVTLIANYQPLQDAYGGPNYFSMDPNALYEIHVDNNGDAKEDITFQFRFQNKLAGDNGVTLNIGGKSGRDPADPGRPGRPTPTDRGAQPARDLHARRRARRPPQRQRRSRSTNAAGGSSHLRQAGRQHRRQDDPRLRRLRRQAHLQRQHPGLQRCRRASSSASARTRSRSTWARSSTSSTPRSSVITDPALINAVPNTIGDKNVTTLALEVHKCLPDQGRRRHRRLDHGQPAPGAAARPDADVAATRPARSSAAPGCRSRAWACRWSTRSSSA